MSQKPFFDHIVILVPHSLQLSPPQSLTSKFTLTPGGTHADGLTCNTLICFKDGSYISLASVINDDEEVKKKYWWREAKFGEIFDIAVDSREGAEENWKRMRDVGVEYERPKKGGRVGLNGESVEWEVSYPVIGGKRGYAKGEVPFWCHGITERSWRAPDGEKNVKHPCGAKGIGGITVWVDKERVDGLRSDYQAILGVEEMDGMIGVGRPRDEEKLGVVKILVRADGKRKGLGDVLLNIGNGIGNSEDLVLNFEQSFRSSIKNNEALAEYKQC